MPILVHLAHLAHADTVRVLVHADPSGVELLDAWRTADRAPVGGVGDLVVLDAAGRVVATASAEVPHLRSVIAADGGHGDTVLEEDVTFLVEVPWIAGAAEVRLGASARRIRPPPLVGPQATLVQGDGGAGRQDLVFLSEGYTSAQMATFRADVDVMVAQLGAVEPYGAYTDLFNIWLLEVPSQQSGADHPSLNDYRNTAFSCAYDCGGTARLICCSGNVVGTASTAVPQQDGIVVLVNDPQYGGSGGSNFATSYNGASMGDVAIHEMGHSLAGLWDEYTYGYALGGPTASPNCSFDPAQTPWDHWLDVPGVGSYAPCSYTDYYRSTGSACLMNVLQDTYCPVCRERVVRQFYSALPGMVEATSPPQGPVAVGPTDHLTFSLEVLGPDDGSAEVAWTLDGAPLASGTVAGGGDTFEVDACTPSGVLTAQVTDPTAWVREDPNGLLTDQASWTLSVSAPDPRPVAAASGQGAAAAAIDGDLGTAWVATTPRAIGFDLGAPRTVGGVDIAWYRGAQGRSRFVVLVSDDAQTWTPVVDTTSRGGTAAPEHYPFAAPVTARFLGVRVLGTTAGAQGGVRELTVTCGP